MKAKATELRIGNYINNVKGKPFEILHGEDIDRVDKNSIAYTAIPLTEEWLVKFGFDKNKYNEEGYYKAHKIDVYKFKKGYFFIYLIDNKFGIGLHDVWDGIDITINHVHQLQNLYYALTQKELTI